MPLPYPKPSNCFHVTQRTNHLSNGLQGSRPSGWLLHLLLIWWPPTLPLVHCTPTNRPLCCSSDRPSTQPSQDLCTCCPTYQGHLSPRYQPGSLPHLLHTFSTWSSLTSWFKIATNILLPHLIFLYRTYHYQIQVYFGYLFCMHFPLE